MLTELTHLFTPLKDTRGRLFLPVIVFDEVTGNSNYAIKTYDVNGDTVSTQMLTDMVTYEATPSKITSRSLVRSFPSMPSCKLSDGSVAFIYAYNEYSLTPPNNFIQGSSKAFIARVNSEGKLVSNEMVDEIISLDRDSFDRRKIHTPSFVTPKGMCFTTIGGESVCGEITATQLSQGSGAEFRYDGDAQDNSFAILPTGHKVTSTYQVSGADHLKIKIASPIYAKTPSEQRVANSDISGKYTANSALTKEMLSVSREEKTDLQITPNPNSYLGVIGFDSNSLAKMSFPVTDRSQVQIYSTNSNQYSLEDLLAGKFNPSLSQALTLPRRLSAEEQSQTERDAKIMKVWEDAFTSEELRKLPTTKFDILNGTFSNSTDDTYGYYLGDDDATVDDDAIDETILEDVAQPYTVILLPNNQTIILVGVNATEVAKTPEVYFLTAAEITQFPSGMPSSQPSGKPSSLPSSSNPSSYPSGLPSSTPTHNPIAGDLIMPTGNPSGLPSSQPSVFPSSEPTQDPSNNPSSKPSSEPTEKPSLRKYAPSSIPSFVATEKNSNSPSSQPSQIPWQKPTERPSQRPTALTSQDDLATSKPSWNPTTNPSLNPSSIPSSRSPAPSAATTIISTFNQTSLQTQSQTEFQTQLHTANATTQNSIFPTIQPTNQLIDPSNSKPSSRMSATEIGLITGGTIAFVGVLGAAAYKFFTRTGQKQSAVHPKSGDYREEVDEERNEENGGFVGAISEIKGSNGNGGKGR